MSNVTAVREEFDAAIEAALKVVLFERAIAADPTALNATLKAEGVFMLAAKALIQAAEERIPPGNLPRGWDR